MNMYAHDAQVYHRFPFQDLQSAIMTVNDDLNRLADFDSQEPLSCS